MSDSAIMQAHDTVLLISEDGKKFHTQLRAGHRQHTHQGIIEHDQLIGQIPGRKITSTTGHTYVVIEPSLAELVKGINRKTQIVYPKEAGRIIFKLNIYPGRRVIEAGTGSGALTITLARFVGPTGRVYTYEANEDLQQNARANLEKTGLSDVIEFNLQNISEGFAETNVDALFLDVREPWKYLPQAKAALKPSGFFGAIVPTTNQISDLLIALKSNDFGGPEVEEVLLRTYKTNPGRLRPHDVMVGHTGYLVFARNIDPDILPVRLSKKAKRRARTPANSHKP
ncbi:MAG: tRNA (adenine-N1)-methyltransferase [Chloroflexi bacterium]|nr:tRNA (adenine-N1)-methyltransferase [Chloroflexota bacterium]